MQLRRLVSDGDLVRVLGATLTPGCRTVRGATIATRQRVVLTSTAAAALVCSAAAAQQRPVFRAETALVPIYATVTGPDGRLMTGLSQRDFVVEEDGRMRPIEVFSTDPGPVTGLALWDVSPDMRRDQERTRASARALVQALWPTDRIRIGTFSSQEFAVSPLLTGDKAVLRRIIDEEIWFSTDYSALWASIEAGINRLASDSGRRVLLTLTAGRSSSDSRSHDDVVRAMHRADIQVYAVGLEQSGLSDSMRALAEESGGGHVVIGESADLDRTWAGILYELHHQYLIGFIPASSDDGRHDLRVTSAVPGARVRARRAHVRGSRMP